MCGIVGWLDWERDLREHRGVLEGMVQTLSRRGPDAEGFWVTQRLAFAHRRLSVIDLEGGKQPMTCRYGDRDYALNYNGELYNFVELRRELKALGHVFETNSDTEVLLRAYVEWGPACVDRLNGIFAFGVWDAARQELFLARDQLGVKPLFYTQRGSAVLFASEPKALLRNPLVPAEVDAEGLAELLCMGPLGTPGCAIFRGVHELRAGHVARFTRERAQVVPYWRLNHREHRHDLVETSARVRSLLEESVRRQLVADVPVGCLLSGGLDSSGVVAIAADIFRREGRPPLDVFTLDFVDDDKHFQADALRRDRDYPWAKRVADHLGVNRHDVVLDTSDLTEHLVEAMHARDQPTAGEIETSLLVLFRRIKPSATVILSGESADEVFGGYPWHYVSEDAVSADPSAATGRDTAFADPSRTFPWLPSGSWPAVYSPELLSHLNPEEYVRDCYRKALAEVPREKEDSPSEARRREVFYLTLTRFLRFLLDRKDRMSMATSVEVRVPFCDHLLVEYVWNVPWEMKFTGGIEKGLLRRALAGYLPDDALSRRKSAYPAHQNPAYVKAIAVEALRIAEDSTSPIRALFDVAAVRRFADLRAWPTQPLDLAARKFCFESVIQLHHWMRDYKVVLC